MKITRRDFLQGSLGIGLGGLIPGASYNSLVQEGKSKEVMGGTNYLDCEILIVGGSFGGISAALAAAKMGKRVILTEETNWIGGQATTQGVPLDEHPWIEHYGRNQSYANFRTKIRNYYRTYYPLSYAARKDPYLNPGAAWVTRLGYEPVVGLSVLKQMIAPYTTNGNIIILTRHKPVHVETDANFFKSVTFHDLELDVKRHISAPYILDATELGDLLELGNVEHVIGAESKSETGEPNAYRKGDPLRQQPFTHLIAVDYRPGENHVIDKPKNYKKYRDHFQEIVGSLPNEKGNDKQLRFKRLFAPKNPNNYEPCIWNFRRYFYIGNFQPGIFPSDITSFMVGSYNEPLVGVPKKEMKHHLEQAKQLTLSGLYYFQTEIENGYKGELGFPGIRPRGDILGTLNGLAQYPYIRESRRIKAEFTVLEQHFRIDQHPKGPVLYPDSVGLGGYRIDIHEKRKKSSFTKELNGKHWPQQIPLGCLIPKRVENMIPACKNIGTTHVTNGAFRVHPVEWNIGEAAGTLAAYCLERKLKPRGVRNIPKNLQEFQRLLRKNGVEMRWPKLQPANSYNSHFVNVSGWYWGEANLKYE